MQENVGNDMRANNYQLVCNILVDLKKLDPGGMYRQRICIP